MGNNVTLSLLKNQKTHGTVVTRYQQIQDVTRAELRRNASKVKALFSAPTLKFSESADLVRKNLQAVIIPVTPPDGVPGKNAVSNLNVQLPAYGPNIPNIWAEFELSAIAAAGILVDLETLRRKGNAGIQKRAKVSDPTARKQNPGKRETKCDICDKDFRTRKYMLKHRLRHVTASNFKCPKQQCGKRFKEKRFLQQHLSMVHEKLFASTCQFCKKSFSHPGSHSNHEKFHCKKNPTRISKAK